VLLQFPSLRNSRKSDKTKKVEEKLTSSVVSGKVFDIDFLQKYVYGVFGLPLELYRETPKNGLKQKAKRKKLGLVGSSKVNRMYVGFFLSAPCTCPF
jgi:hypothetical protein